MTKQWEKYREIIIAEYKDLNKPLHEVRRVMMEKYGFRASTRAYRSRFDRWGVHKYSRRRRSRSMSPSQRGSISDGPTRGSPPLSPDIDESDSPEATPHHATPPDELLIPGTYVATPGVGFRGSLGLVKPDFPYASVTSAQSPALSHSAAFGLPQFGSGLAVFGPQDIGCYPPSCAPYYRQGPREVMAAASEPSSQGGMTSSQGYRYSTGLLRGQG